MKAYLKAFFLAPFFAVISLILVAPALALAVIAYTSAPWFTVPDEWQAMFDEYYAKLPIDSAYLETSPDIATLAAIVVAGWLTVLFFYHMLRAALLLARVAPQGGLWSILFTARPWWAILPAGLIAYALFVVAMIGSPETTDTMAQALQRPPVLTDLMGYYQSYDIYLRAVFVAVAAMFVPCGLTIMLNASIFTVEVRMFLRDLPALAVLAVVHAVIAAGVTFIAFQFIAASGNAALVAATNSVWAMLLANSILFYAIMASASAILLQRRLSKFADTI